MLYNMQTGVIYKSRTVFEDATPELVRDFFWDDEFRPKWDPMLVYFKMLDECPHTGTSIVHWIKKVPSKLRFVHLCCSVLSCYLLVPTVCNLVFAPYAVSILLQ